MSKKTADQKTEKQTEASKPDVLKDDELGNAQGGIGGSFESEFATGGKGAPGQHVNAEGNDDRPPRK